MTALANVATLYRRRESLPLRTRLMFTFGAVAIRSNIRYFWLATVPASSGPRTAGAQRTP